MTAPNTSSGQVSSLKVRHHRTQAELDKYKLLVESIQDYAIFLMDRNGYIQTWNKGAERFKGYKPEEIIGRHFSVFYLDRDKKASKPERELKLARKVGRVEDEDWRMRKDGSHFWANVVITALYDDNGELVGFAKVTRDLTERKMHEDALRRANGLLKQQQQELRQLNVSKDEFISLASHQLRTPATAIKQLLGILLEGFKGELPEEIDDIIKKAYESNERQIAIVNSLLKVAQIDAGKVVLKKTPANIGMMLMSIFDEYNDRINQRGQTLTIDIEDDFPAVLVDAEHFRMAIENMIDNASKYTPERGLIKVSVKSSDNNFKICILDNGVGIEEKDVPKLFEKFIRIPNDLSDHVGGSGLGLYWVQKVVQLHGGKIDVQSKPGTGTMFIVTVPKGQVGA